MLLMESLAKIFSKIKIPEIKISDSCKEIVYLSFAYLYGGSVGLATLYGVKKGIEKWWNWKQIRTYRKISIDYIESVLNIACDGGMLTYYMVMCGLSNAAVAATCPVSVPLLLHYFEESKENKNN